MILVLAFCQQDAHLALELLDWCAELGGCKNHEALLVIDAGTDWQNVSEAQKLAAEVFKSYSIVMPERPVQGWIRGSVELFRQAALWAEEHNVPFLWLEPDAIPLSPHWLDKIEKAYSECGKPFLGTLLKSSTPKFPNPYMEGVAVYPADTWRRFAPHWNPEESWVITTAPASVPECVHTPLIQMLWGTFGIATSFVPHLTIHSQPQDKTLDFIDRRAVIYHRSKDSSLIRLLRGRLFQGQPDYTNPPAFVQMGRYGDLILLLPAFQAWAQRSGRKTVVVTSLEFGSIFEGVSYVQAILLKYTWFEAGMARNWAMARYPRVIVTQLHGADIPTVPDDLPSYSLSMWNRTELLAEYQSLPLVFDQRVMSREKLLVEAHTAPRKPIILVKFDGWTSPFDGAAVIKSRLAYWSDKFQIVDLDKVRAHRIFDLLALFDIATGLITSDTFTIHLAPASPVQYLAFTRDDGQSGSVPKGQCVLQIGYSQWQNQMNAFDLQMNLWACHPKPI